jgi:hypothetical protein
MWSFASIQAGSDFGVPYQYANLTLQVTDQPVTDATIYLNGTGFSSPITLSFTAATTQGNQVYSRYDCLVGFNYQPGNSYSLTSETSLGTASATLIAPGNISIASDGSQISWTISGTETDAQVYDGPDASGTKIYYSTTSLPSPFNLPNSLFSNPGIYSVSVQVVNTTNSIPGAAGGALFVADILSQNVTISAPTATPTLSNTPTVTTTPTLFATMTPTFSPTPLPATPTPTLPVPVGRPYVFPNPAPGPRVNFVYQMAEAGTVWIGVYNAWGDRVDALTESQPAGTHSSALDVSPLAPGHYFYQVILTYGSGRRDKFDPQVLAVEK